MTRTSPPASARQLARAVGKSHAAVANWLNRDDWPFGRGPWNAAAVQKIRAWAQTNLSPDPARESPDEPANSPPVNSPRTQNLVLKNAKLAIEVAEKKKLLHRDDECRERRVRQIRAIAQEFGAVGGKLAANLVGKTQTEIQTAIDAEVRRILEDFSRAPMT